MGISYGSKGIATDGLVLYFDPTNPRSGTMPSSGYGINNQHPNVMPYPTDIFSWSGAASRNHCTQSRALGNGVVDTTITEDGNYTSAGTYLTSGSFTGTGCTVTVTVNHPNGSITGITVAVPGGGYEVDDELEILSDPSEFNLPRFSVDSTTGVISPVGDSPLRMECTGSDPYISTYNSSTWNLASASAGESWDFSVWCKGDSPSNAAYYTWREPQLFIFGVDSTGDIAWEETHADGVSLTITQPYVTSSWQRYTFGHTFSSSFVEQIQVRLDGDQDAYEKVYWWDGLDVRKSPTWFDLITGKEGALPGGVTFDDGHINFNGHTTYATLRGDLDSSGNRSTDLGISGEVSVFAWIKPSVEGWNNQRVFYKGGTEDDTSRLGFTVTYRSNIDAFSATLKINNGNSFYTHEAFPTNVWAYVGFTADGTINVLYVDGIEVNRVDNTEVPAGGKEEIFIGSRGEWDNNFTENELDGPYSGSMDIVQVYNKALTSTEVQRNYNVLKMRFQ